jgi:hypothetical protein
MEIYNWIQIFKVKVGLSKIRGKNRNNKEIKVQNAKGGKK